MAEVVPTYLLYLAGVAGNSVTFGVITHCVRWVSRDREIRGPSLLNSGKVDQATDSLDKAAPLIEDWVQLYAWLGRGTGWAKFTTDSAAKLLPHWLGESVEYDCVRFRVESIRDLEFVEPSVLPDLAVGGLSLNLAGTGPGEGAIRWFSHLTSNLVLSKRPLFPEVSESVETSGLAG